MDESVIKQAQKATLVVVDYLELLSKSIKASESHIHNVTEFVRGMGDAFNEHLGTEAPVEDEESRFTAIDFRGLEAMVRTAKKSAHLGAIPNDGNARALLDNIESLVDTVKPLNEDERDVIMNGNKSVLLDHAERFINDGDVRLAAAENEQWSADKLVVGLRAYLLGRF